MMRAIARFRYSRFKIYVPRLQLRPRKEPSQGRSRATVDVILDAATRVLAKHSLVGFNTNRVAEVAGVSIGSLYQYFPNKTALIVALLDREHGRLASELEAAVQRCAGLDLSEGLSVLARLAIRQQFQEPLFAAALDHEERRLPTGALARHHEQRLGVAVMTFLAMHRNTVPSDRLTSTVARDLLLMTRALVEADLPDTAQPPADLEQRLVRAMLGYLLTPHPATKAGHAA